MTLKPLPVVLVAFVTAAFTAGIAFGLEVILATVFDGPQESVVGPNQMAYFFPSAVLGFIVSLTFQVVIVGPILVVFSKIKWPFADFWNGITLGFFVAAVPTFLVFLTPVEGVFSESLGNFANGRPTLKGVSLASYDALLLGLVGAVCGLVFWIIAVDANVDR